MSKFADYRDDKVYKECRKKYDDLQAQVKPVELKIRTLLSEAEAAKSNREAAETMFLAGRAGAETLMDLRAIENERRARAEAAQVEAADVYARWAEARQELADAQSKAEAKCIAELAPIANKLADAVSAKVLALKEANDSWNELWQHIVALWPNKSQPGGFVDCSWRRGRITDENIAGHKAWRNESALLETQEGKRAKAKLIADNLARLTRDEESRERGRELERERIRKQTPISTRDLSPSHLVRTTFFPVDRSAG